ncbi:MAG TPA: urease accessory UreF family protein, partial [Segetibacter sp.]
MFNNHLLSLLQLTDPTLPIGGFSHSSGLETYVQAGIVNNVETANSFVTQTLAQNLKYTDAAFVSLAFDEAEQSNIGQLLELDNECTAVKLPREMRQASQKLGLRLLKIFSVVHPNLFVDDYLHAINTKATPGNYCVVFGLYASILHIPKADALV